MHTRHRLAPETVFVEADDRALAGVDLRLDAVAGFLDLAALVALLHRGDDTAERVHLAEDIEDRLLDLALEHQQAGRAPEEVHGVLEEAGLLEEDRLAVRGEQGVFLGRCGERLVGGVRVA